MSGNTVLTGLRDERLGLSTPRMSAPGRTSEAVIAEWDMLLRAVQARLRGIVGDTSNANAASHGSETGERASTEVLECVDALLALQTTLTHELSRRPRLEDELAAARAALAQCSAELADTRRDERHARHLAMHDSLTSLPNRRCFGERLDDVLARVGPAQIGPTVFYLDLDGVKAINDRHGHDTGDELLKIVAARLCGALRVEDLVCRLGGDEFACLITDMPNRERLGQLACKLFDTVSAPMQIGELTLIVRPSIGIATCPADGCDGAVLIKHADTAMYRAKREQTGYAFFELAAQDRASQVTPPAARGEVHRAELHTA